MDSLLSRVCLVQVGGYKLKSDSLAAHIILEASWTFVVKHLELGAKVPIGELGIEDGVARMSSASLRDFIGLGMIALLSWS